MTDFLELSVDKFTFRIAPDRAYDDQGLWLLQVPNGVRVGLSDYLQQRIGDVAFAEVTGAGSHIGADDEFAVLETIKVSLSVASPLEGTLVAVNDLLDAEPEAINDDPYGKGWLAEISPDSDAGAYGGADTVSPEQYLALVEAEARNEVEGGNEA